MDLQNYLNMQKAQYEYDASTWSLENRNPVVGSYDEHNNWSDYDTYLFKDFDTTGLVALEYGCGPGRNIIKFNDRFSQIDGVDIAANNIEKAKLNLTHNNIIGSNLYVCNGKSIPIADNTYDVVFSVICLQHIACYDIRFSIMSDIKRVLKPGGRFCFQMGFGGKPSGYTVAQYYENAVDATVTNSGHDVSIEDENNLKDDLLNKLGFTNYKSDIRPVGPGDSHNNWIWVQVEK
jgi:ubiquinone/menaquinone biosynthesis C-methylase UbiE